MPQFQYRFREKGFVRRCGLPHDSDDESPSSRTARHVGCAQRSFCALCRSPAPAAGGERARARRLRRLRRGSTRGPSLGPIRSNALPRPRTDAGRIQDDIFSWHFTVRGPKSSDFEGQSTCRIGAVPRQRPDAGVLCLQTGERPFKSDTDAVGSLPQAASTMDGSLCVLQHPHTGGWSRTKTTPRPLMR